MNKNEWRNPMLSIFYRLQFKKYVPYKMYTLNNILVSYSLYPVICFILNYTVFLNIFAVPKYLLKKKADSWIQPHLNRLIPCLT